MQHLTQAGFVMIKISDRIIELIRKGESEIVEFKKTSGTLREAIETVCAFANHRGGYLFMGVDDSGKVPGLQATDDTLKNIANAIKLNTDHRLYPSIETIEIEGKTCILVSVEESPLKPHLAYGRAFLRVGTTNQKIDREKYEYLLSQRFNGYGFDYRVEQRAGLDDIDTDVLYEFLETANSVRNLNENLMLPAEMILRKLDLMTEEGITKAAVLLFGKTPQKFFSDHFEIKCGKFVSDIGYEEIANEKEFKQNLIRNFYSALDFVMESMVKRTEKGAIHRRETWEFPVTVVREALVNMIVHRDYRQDIKSTVEVRPSTISFYNPALLFEPTITVERLKSLHPSRPGNRLIAKIFYLMGLFENWGGGTLKILNETVAAGKPEPAFFFDGGMFRLVLYRQTR
jgi:ATP-dependent DNA helicase RecG